MIRHIVMIKLLSTENKEDKIKHSQEIKEALETLPSQIDVIKFYQVGLNLSESPRAYDIVLISDFEDLNRLDEYRVHPAHIKVVELIRKYSEDMKAVDFDTKA